MPISRTLGRHTGAPCWFLLAVLCAIAALSVVQSAQAGEDKPGYEGRIAAVVGARQATKGELDWKLVTYDKERLFFIGDFFKPDKNGPGPGGEGTKFFVFLPLKAGKTEALLELRKGEAVKGRLQVEVKADKFEVAVTTTEIKKDQPDKGE